MNWRLSKLDKYTLVSFSDSHSPYPWRLGREACAFDLADLSYKALFEAIKTRKNFLFTIEVEPSYGKYHYDGHRVCNYSCEPKEALKNKNTCPNCHACCIFNLSIVNYLRRQSIGMLDLIQAVVANRQRR